MASGAPASATGHLLIFAVGPMQPLQPSYAARAPLAGADVRVSLEDNLYLFRGRLATNDEYVQEATEMTRSMCGWSARRKCEAQIARLSPPVMLEKSNLPETLPRAVGLLGASVIDGGWAHGSCSTEWTCACTTSRPRQSSM
ncbi:hypothetical protein CWO91_25305 [Bradyrhizobium genosp. SA-3]|uniref:3-keto-5-aminohexanoate cleavage protein n=1 Tax=Bradyrhizobium genosp. SA-3 TaxID=508868 RepID=UPI0010D0E3A3|nr:hypothetical protein CWO91_25305 [Bradyrhizobium genosp. SA-3]